MSDNTMAAGVGAARAAAAATPSQSTATANNTTFAVWTGDWDASPQDDLNLIPGTEQNVYQKAFATVEKKLRAK